MTVHQEVRQERSPALRPDLVQAHRETWQHIAAPGAYWDGRERLAIARAAREAWSCARCVADAEGGTTPAHTPRDGRDPAIVDTVHRVTTGPGRLTKRVCDDFLAHGYEPGHYAELVAITSMAVSSDVFCHALGTEPHPHPEPIGGAPTGKRVTCEDRDSAWVPLVASRDPNIRRALSLVPSESERVFALAAVQYVPFDRFFDLGYRRGIDRTQMEVLAARVSALNQCFY